MALQKARYDQGEKTLGYADLCKALMGGRNSTDTPWLKDSPVHPLQQALKDLDNAIETGQQFAAYAPVVIGDGKRIPLWLFGMLY